MICPKMTTSVLPLRKPLMNKSKQNNQRPKTGDPSRTPRSPWGLPQQKVPNLKALKRPILHLPKKISLAMRRVNSPR
jgi:hypothetical protein